MGTDSDGGGEGQHGVFGVQNLVAAVGDGLGEGGAGVRAKIGALVGQLRDSESLDGSSSVWMGWLARLGIGGWMDQDQMSAYPGVGRHLVFGRVREACLRKPCLVSIGLVMEKYGAPFPLFLVTDSNCLVFIESEAALSAGATLHPARPVAHDVHAIHCPTTKRKKEIRTRLNLA